jgi:5-formyltetrahydrofolate cyclo-ligase
MMTKADLRSEARTARARLAVAQSGFAGAIAKFVDQIVLEPYAPVASYWAVRDEADPRGLAAALGSLGHPLLLPCVADSSGPLIFRRWREGDAMRTNAHGVSEPLETSSESIPYAILVPLLAFDAEGFRLGYGGGYYDRTLAHLRGRGSILAIGIAYAGQEANLLPRDVHDEKLDAVITEKGIRQFVR